MSREDVEPLSSVEWQRLGATLIGRCRLATAVGIFLSGGLLVDGLLSTGSPWHWWALISLYALAMAAYHWFDVQFWKRAQFETQRMRRQVARDFPDYLEEFDRRFPEAIPLPEPAEPRP